MFCTDLSLGQHAFGETEYRVLRCRNWTCQYCAGMRKRELVRMAEAGNPNSFITLTVSPHWFDSPEHRAKKLVIAWRKLRRKAIKKYDLEALPFLAVFEKTKLGEPHLHIIARVDWISQSWISDFMETEMGAPIVWIERIKDARKVASYVGKYIAKDPHAFKGCKRYWRSQDYLPKSTEEDEDQELELGPVWIEDSTLDRLESWFMQMGVFTRREKHSLFASHAGGPSPPKGLRPQTVSEDGLWQT